MLLVAVLLLVFTVFNLVAYYEGVKDGEASAGGGPTAAPETEPDPEWLRLWYDKAHSDIQWAKERSWNALYWAIVLMGAIVLSHDRFGNVKPGIWMMVVITVSIVAALHVYQLHGFARRARVAAVDRILKRAPYWADFIDHPTRDRHHGRWLWFKLVALVLASGLSVFALLPSTRAGLVVPREAMTAEPRPAAGNSVLTAAVPSRGGSLAALLSPAALSAVAASLAAVAALLMWRIQRRNYIEAARPELVLEGWGRDVRGSGDTRREVIVINKVRNIGSGAALNVYMNAESADERVRPLVSMSTIHLSIPGGRRGPPAGL